MDKRLSLYDQLDGAETDVVRKAFIFERLKRNQKLNLDFAHQRYLFLVQGTLKLFQVDRRNNRRLIRGMLHPPDLYSSGARQNAGFTYIEAVAINDCILASTDILVFRRLCKEGFLDPKPWMHALLRFLWRQDNYINHLLENDKQRRLARIFIHFSRQFGDSLPVSLDDFEAMIGEKNDDAILKIWNSFIEKGWIKPVADKILLQDKEQILRIYAG